MADRNQAGAQSAQSPLGPGKHQQAQTTHQSNIRFQGKQGAGDVSGQGPIFKRCKQHGCDHQANSPKAANPQDGDDAFTHSIKEHLIYS